MADFIDRQEAITKLYALAERFCKGNYYDESVGVERAIREIERIPASDIKTVVHAHNNNQTYIGADEFRCSKCGIHIDDWLKFDSDDVGIEEFEFKYCPNCGAKMDEEETNEPT